MANREFRDRLKRRAKVADIAIEPALVEKLETYYQLLAKWNAKINLSAYRLTPEGEDDAIDRLLIEPLAAARYVPESARTLLDAGTGGGSPAIPFVLAAPQLHLRMVEVKTRKAVFLREAVRTLGLANALVETARFEELLTRPELHEAQDLVSIRAVRIETRTLLTLQAFLRPGGKIFLFRGPGGLDLAESTPPPLAWMATYPLVESLQSRLVVLSKTRV
ncbi:MAG: 16S rRNA (guanine(527)-N(7))-methyltransferase RsmG [Vicinamibacterales bacterium]